MEPEKFLTAVPEEKILHILSRITKGQAMGLRQVCQRYGPGENEVRRYDAYQAETDSGRRILKKTGQREAFNYETYLAGKGYPVPDYYGKYVDGDDVWILIEAVSGQDLRHMTDALAIQTADCLTQLQNDYWQADAQAFSHCKTDGRFEAYWERILRRGSFVQENGALRDAYRLFLDRQLTCPRTLSNGDLLQCNVMQSGGRVKIIDWGFGGILPYSLDIARFLAHATPEGCTFPFFMTLGQKELFVKCVYEKLKAKPGYQQYLQDIRLSVLNEYLEFVEADEDDDHWYAQHAMQLAGEILQFHG